MKTWQIPIQCGMPHIVLMETETAEEALQQLDADRRAKRTATYSTLGGPVTIDWSSCNISKIGKPRNR